MPQRIIIIISMLVFSVCVWGQTELPDSAKSKHGPVTPLANWSWADLIIKLNGKTYIAGALGTPSIAESYREQKGKALIDGETYEYWLYDTFTYHNGDSTELYRMLFQYIEDYFNVAVDYDNITIVDNNTGLASSVKKLMLARNCDISVLIPVRYDGPVKDNKSDSFYIEYNYGCMIINEYIATTKKYRMTYVPFFTGL